MFKFENNNISGKHYSFNAPYFYWEVNAPMKCDQTMTLRFDNNEGIIITVMVDETSCEPLGDWNPFEEMCGYELKKEIPIIKRGSGESRGKIYILKSPFYREVYKEKYEFESNKEKFSFILEIEFHKEKGDRRTIEKILEKKDIKAFLNSIRYF